MTTAPHASDSLDRRAPAGDEQKAADVLAHAWAVLESVPDPEIPVVSIRELGILRGVEQAEDGALEVVITPTYSGCPAMATMRDDLVHRLTDEGFADVRVRVQLDPPWTSDWISDHGRAALRAAGISGPGPAPRRTGPVPLTLSPTRRAVACPRCGSADVEVTSEFGSTACKALYRCRACLEPFDHLKEI
jgi:ring-1,2-phenylacetyl-CoA epoxidase subunit PaaD